MRGEKDADPAWGHSIQFRNPEEFRWRHVVLAVTVVTVNFGLIVWDQVSETPGLREPLTLGDRGLDSPLPETGGARWRCPHRTEQHDSMPVGGTAETDL